MGLRARLTLYFAAASAVVLTGVGFLFRSTLDSTLNANTTLILEQEWATVRAYLRLGAGKPEWIYDSADSEESFIVQRVRRIFMLANSQGRVLEASEVYSRIGIESADEILTLAGRSKPIWRTRTDPDGTSYLLRTSTIHEGGRSYLITIGRALTDNRRILDQFIWRFAIVAPALVALLGIVGWVFAGRALVPLNDVAHAAQSITGDNLRLHIPVRGAGDELDHLISSFNAMVDRLEESFNQIRQFSIDASHELRTPLTALRGELEVAIFTARSEDQYRDAIITAIADVDRLSKVVRALLQLGQAESGQLALAKDKIDLSALTLNIAENFENPAELQNLVLSKRIDSAIFVEGDRIQLERLLTNLLSNALKYTPAGGSIAVELRRLEGQARLSVIDTGCGIPAEHLPHIFERFYRVPEGPRDAERGLGLGLSFVSWIVRAHGGTIDVRSQPGHGTRFDVWLPGVRGTRHATPAPGRQTVS